ncbi:hypothetical protein C8R31_10575 [Nitrosospira sp. Nsp2]|uniref:hypothetical protein n=1 Tax=Nitrosospira sp. Nsp2 TaxID=136548 RepID=UPI000D3282E4|nr:hypothetical protein [Nitrosospira sp. Nsp2]PTR14718.1 hypothetical protein C8R31_10575 [Nitrosospira sp. Nsp2]
MPIPALATDDLINDLNAIRKKGHLLMENLLVARLRKRIDAYKNIDIVEYWLYLSSLYCLTGDVENTIYAGATGLKLTTEPHWHLHHVKTLLKLGKFSLARELMDEVPDYHFLESDPYECYCLFQALDFQRFNRLAHEKAEIMLSPAVRLSEAIQNILARNEVQEQQLLGMIDLAGDLLRERKLIAASTSEIHPYLSDGTITVNLPIVATPSEVADLDWEYAERLFSMMPDAPATIVHVGFSSVPKVVNV